MSARVRKIIKDRRPRKVWTSSSKLNLILQQVFFCFYKGICTFACHDDPTTAKSSIKWVNLLEILHNLLFWYLHVSLTLCMHLFDIVLIFAYVILLLVFAGSTTPTILTTSLEVNPTCFAPGTRRWRGGRGWGASSSPRGWGREGGRGPPMQMEKMRAGCILSKMVTKCCQQ